MIKKVFSHARLPLGALGAYIKSHTTFLDDSPYQVIGEEGANSGNVTSFYASGTSWSVAWSYFHTGSDCGTLDQAIRGASLLLHGLLVPFARHSRTFERLIGSTIRCPAQHVRLHHREEAAAMQTQCRLKGKSPEGWQRSLLAAPQSARPAAMRSPWVVATGVEGRREAHWAAVGTGLSPTLWSISLTPGP